MAIAVIVEEGGAGPPTVAGHARFLRYVGKRAVTVVVVEDVLPEICDIQVRMSVVVIVAGHRAHPIGMSGNTRFFGYISEGSVSVVAVQPVPIARCAFVGPGAFRHRVR